MLYKTLDALDFFLFTKSTMAEVDSTKLQLCTQLIDIWFMLESIHVTLLQNPF